VIRFDDIEAQETSGTLPGVSPIKFLGEFLSKSITEHLLKNIIFIYATFYLKYDIQ